MTRREGSVAMFRHACCCVLALIVLASCGPEPAQPPVVPPPAPTAATQPSPQLTPDQVVRLVTEAMGHNDTPAVDAGIATAFAFASPGNRQATGPLARFVPMVKHPTYAPLLNYATIEYTPIRVAGDYAEQLVTVTDKQGNAAAFLWILSRQVEGEYEDCWMTDGVTRLGIEPVPPDPNQRREQDAGPEIRV